MLVTIAIYDACMHCLVSQYCQLVLRREFLSFPVFYISSLGFHVQVYEHVGIYTLQDKRPEMQESAPTRHVKKTKRGRRAVAVNMKPTRPARQSLVRPPAQVVRSTLEDIGKVRACFHSAQKSKPILGPLLETSLQRLPSCRSFATQ